MKRPALARWPLSVEGLNRSWHHGRRRAGAAEAGCFATAVAAVLNKGLYKGLNKGLYRGLDRGLDKGLKDPWDKGESDDA
jgi:hypothetical protein